MSHQCVLAYPSDWSLLDTATLPHGVRFMQPNAQMASLDHAMWFHRPFRADTGKCSPAKGAHRFSRCTGDRAVLSQRISQRLQRSAH